MGLPGRIAAVVLLLLVAWAPALQAQQAPEAQLSLTFELDPAAGEVTVTLTVEDPGSLAELRLALGALGTRVANEEPTLSGAWHWDGEEAVADLREDPRAQASWRAQGRIEVVSSEGEGHTSYVGEGFALLKASDMVPQVRYSYPQGQEPAFRTTFQVVAPGGWDVRGPWPAAQDGFQLDGIIPRGFLAAGPDLVTARLGQGPQAYNVVRVAGAEEEATTRTLLEASDT
ncbi:MAG: hypothetical protein R3185_09780, partial [Candidatus Thermoplasmatota archaeon]|nr:hypothetical protein [Candidatus Thermoplasmatota archaeon]